MEKVYGGIKFLVLSVSKDIQIDKYYCETLSQAFNIRDSLYDKAYIAVYQVIEEVDRW